MEAESESNRPVFVVVNGFADCQPKIFSHLINRLPRESGNPLLKLTLRRWASFPHDSVLKSITILVDALFTITQQRTQFQSLRCECIRSIIK
jgi:hypothetical protein